MIVRAGGVRAGQIHGRVERWPRCGDLGWGARKEGEESGVTHRVLTWMME